MFKSLRLEPRAGGGCATTLIMTLMMAVPVSAQQQSGHEHMQHMAPVADDHAQHTAAQRDHTRVRHMTVHDVVLDHVHEPPRRQRGLDCGRILEYQRIGVDPNHDIAPVNQLA